MINIIIKKISSFFVLALLVTLINIISASHNDSMAACTWDAANTRCSGTPTTGTTSCASATTSAACTTADRGATAAAATVSDADNNKIVDTLCNVFKMATGKGGKAFAAFAIISLGIGFFTGKVSWGLMIGVAAGIAAMFGAPTIVSAISGEDAVAC